MKLFAKPLLSALSVSALLSASPAMAVDLEFYFPVAVGGPVAEIVQGLTDSYVAQNPDVKITPVYTGSYRDTSTKALTAARGGNPPQIAVLLANDLYTFIDEDVIVPFDDHLAEDEKSAWFGAFYPAFMANGQTGGKTYGIPFQRSTPVMFWNKAAFAEAGLDPAKAPETWAEMVAFGKVLTKKDASGNVTQWGVRIPSAGFPIWLFQGLTASSGLNIGSEDGKSTKFDDPAAITALQYMIDLSTKDGVMQPGTIDWGSTPQAFLEGNAAMIWTTTGNFANIRDNATFDFGVAMLPANTQRGVPTGGGNFYLFKDSTDEEKAAAVDFVRWISEPEQAAAWSIATGYVAPRADAWETAAMKDYVAKFPAAEVARDQLAHAIGELSTYENAKIAEIINSALEAAISGAVPAETALKDAQAKTEAILSAFR
ncbi:MAG: ABC transporter substrate-binding protein [Paracoccaceae bacterium]